MTVRFSRNDVIAFSLVHGAKGTHANPANQRTHLGIKSCDGEREHTKPRLLCYSVRAAREGPSHGASSHRQCLRNTYVPFGCHVDSLDSVLTAR